MVTAAKLADAERSVTAISRRLLEAVPFNEPWGTDKVLAEYSRLNGGLSMDRHKGAWCLSQLIEAGLVRSPMQHHFQRVQARPALAAVKQTQEAAVPVAKPEPPTVLQQLESMARSMRQQAAALTAQADELESLALQMEEERQRDDGAAQQLAQLRKLLGVQA